MKKLRLSLSAFLFLANSKREYKKIENRYKLSEVYDKKFFRGLLNER